MYGAGAVTVTPTAIATAAPAEAKKARRPHRHRSARPTARPARSQGISMVKASARPATASPTPSCP
jgi:hypothetical protein